MKLEVIAFNQSCNPSAFDNKQMHSSKVQFLLPISAIDTQEKINYV
jgi:hypothetical protein